MDVSSVFFKGESEYGYLPLHAINRDKNLSVHWLSTGVIYRDFKDIWKGNARLH